MKTYPLFKVHVPIDEALANIKNVFKSGFINEGEQVTQLTKELQDVLSTEQLVLTNSGTSALTLALRLAGVGPGDEVVTTPMTCVATNTPIINSGAKIVWCDIDPTTGMPSAKHISEKITDKTKAVMVVAWAGTPPDLINIKNLCELKGIKLILDAAHAFGAWIVVDGKGALACHTHKPIHYFADYTAYSFQAIKHFTTGDGGALVCLSASNFERAKCLKWFGLNREHAKDEKGNWKGQQWDVDVSEAGYKFNMNNVSAAVGLSQVSHINDILNTHRKNAIIYNTVLGRNVNVSCLNLPCGAQPSYWVFPMKVVSSIDRDELLRLLNAEGIMAGLVHVPNDKYSAFAECVSSDLLGVREFARTQFNLPCGWWLTESDVRHIASRVIAISDQLARKASNKIVVPNTMRLRNVLIDDHEWLIELHNDPDVLNNTVDPRPITIESHMKWWNSIRDNPKEKRLIFEIDGIRVGFTKFYAIDNYNKNCLLGADIHPNFRGQGLAKYMWALMLNVCFYDLGLYRVALSMASYNLIGQKVYERLGFKTEGVMKNSLLRNGKYEDCICMYMLKEDWTK